MNRGFETPQPHLPLSTMLSNVQRRGSERADRARDARAVEALLAFETGDVVLAALRPSERVILLVLVRRSGRFSRTSLLSAIRPLTRTSSRNSNGLRASTRS
jgi:hypothetical protein